MEAIIWKLQVMLAATIASFHETRDPKLARRAQGYRRALRELGHE